VRAPDGGHSRCGDAVTGVLPRPATAWTELQSETVGVGGALGGRDGAHREAGSSEG
jgi:hypothetical protein